MRHCYARIGHALFRQEYCLSVRLGLVPNRHQWCFLSFFFDLPFLFCTSGPTLPSLFIEKIQGWNLPTLVPSSGIRGGAIVWITYTKSVCISSLFRILHMHTYVLIAFPDSWKKLAFEWIEFKKISLYTLLYKTRNRLDSVRLVEDFPLDFLTFLHFVSSTKW